MWQDVRYTIRSLARHRGFAVAGVLVLALGIGVNGAVFSVINSILFRPLPVRAPDELRYDALTFVTVPTLLASAVLLACCVPAIRASRVDPIVVLRNL